MECMYKIKKIAVLLKTSTLSHREASTFKRAYTSIVGEKCTYTKSHLIIQSKISLPNVRNDMEAKLGQLSKIVPSSISE